MGRRHPHVDHDDVGAVLADGPQQLVGVGHGGDDLEAAVGEQLGQPGPQQDRVLGDHDSHGSSTVIAVGPPGGLSTVRVPSTAAARWASPRSPVPPPSAGTAASGPSGAAAAVVGDDDPQPVADAFDGDLGVAGVGVLGDVGERLGDDEVGDGLDAG